MILVEPHKYRQGAVTMIRRVEKGAFMDMKDHPAVQPKFYVNGKLPPKL